jgi:hypothetical protein
MLEQVTAFLRRAAGDGRLRAILARWSMIAG